MLTKEQIDWIRTNIRNRGIETIDLEHEMVDHISTAVEEKLVEGIPLRDAYKSVVNSFGPFGLQKLQDLKYAKLRKKGRRMIVRNLRVYLNPPKIALTLMLTVVIYALYSFNIDRINIFYPVVFIALVAPMFFLLGFKERIKARENYSSMKALFQIHSIINWSMIIVIMPVLAKIIETSSIYMAVIITIIPVIVCLAFSLSIKQCMAEIKTEFGELALA
ncbi:MAG: hypothetical protein K9H64_05025 [Bacteroidales bacterium]|nr:hypothetical protein [Bacteroidales bacterium]MCF8455200.1 hypothetical protein [Bacteroidales bacterium]